MRTEKPNATRPTRQSLALIFDTRRKNNKSWMRFRPWRTKTCSQVSQELGEENQGFCSCGDGIEPWLHTNQAMRIRTHHRFLLLALCHLPVVSCSKIYGPFYLPNIGIGIALLSVCSIRV